MNAGHHLAAGEWNRLDLRVVAARHPQSHAPWDSPSAVRVVLVPNRSSFADMVCSGLLASTKSTSRSVESCSAEASRTCLISPAGQSSRNCQLLSKSITSSSCWPRATGLSWSNSDGSKVAICPSWGARIVSRSCSRFIPASRRCSPSISTSTCESRPCSRTSAAGLAVGSSSICACSVASICSRCRR